MKSSLAETTFSTRVLLIVAADSKRARALAILPSGVGGGVPVWSW